MWIPLFRSTCNHPIETAEKIAVGERQKSIMADLELVASFTALVSTLHQDSKHLHMLSALRPTSGCLPHKMDLKEIDDTLRKLEQRAADLQDFISTEHAACREIKAVGLSAAYHENLLLRIEAALPPHLPGPVVQKRETTINKPNEEPKIQAHPLRPIENLTDQSEGAEKKVSRKSCKDKKKIKPCVEYATSEELKCVPASTRGRLTLTQINDAVNLLQGMIDEKFHILTMPKSKASTRQREMYDKYRAERLMDHGNAFILSEKDVHQVFKYGTGKGKGTLHTLRSLKRIQYLNAGGKAHYLIVNSE